MVVRRILYHGSPFRQLQSEWLLLVNNVFLQVISQFLFDRCIEFCGALTFFPYVVDGMTFLFSFL